MPEPISVRESPLTRKAGPSHGDRRQWLSLACELDRLRAIRALREASAGFQLHTVLGSIAAAAPSMPGRIGRWIRGASVGATVCRVALLALRG
jgi:hypothetical protein